MSRAHRGGNCLSDEAIAAFVAGSLAAARHGEVDRHLQACPDCAGLVVATMRLQDRPVEPPASGSRSSATFGAKGDPVEPLPPGTRISRYLVGPVLGRGGGGVVHRAHDPQLDRDVAIKLLGAPRHLGAAADDAQARLLREARVMARLAHPNIVYVFDAGVYESRIFIVMELVLGETLADWLACRPRPGRAVLEMFAAAGRGLAAAHTAGVVHGDFKPQNVLVAPDGRVRVTDFGLARIAEARAAVASAPARERDGDFTLVGGTPSYMAPEQIMGQRADARADQFSFAVALHIALYGHHPFETWPPAPAALAAGAVQVLAPKPGADAPGAVREALLRALAVRPEARYPSVTDLVDVIAATKHDGTRERRARRAGVILLVATAVGAGISALNGHTAAPARCGDGVVATGEECDDGNGRDDDACLTSCRWARCGDGVVRSGVELCDDGNQSNADGCSTSCLRCDDGDARFVLDADGHCYTRHDTPLPWAEARERCREAGGDLTSYSNAGESNTVAERLLPGRGEQYWIGLARPRTGAEFAWVGREVLPSNLAAWWAAHDRPGERSCAYEVWRPSSPQPGLALRADWAPAPCSEPRPYLCEKVPSALSPRTHHAYRLLHGATTFSLARSRCAAIGSHLATIRDDEEQQFVAAQARAAVWLGAIDEHNVGNFAWITGEPFTYRHFAPGEPDDRTKYANCIALDSDDLWHDRPCDHEEYDALCEID